MLNGQLFNLSKAFDENFFDNLKGEKFTYALERNEQKLSGYLKQIYTDIREGNKEIIQKHHEYEQKLDTIEKAYIDEENENLIKDRTEKLKNEGLSEEDKKQLEEDLKKYNDIKSEIYKKIEEAIKKFNGENKEVIENFNKINDQFIKIQNQEATFDYYKIKRSIIPSDISYEQRKIINCLIVDDIKESDEEIKK